MEKPQIHIIQKQEIETNQNPNIDSWEAEQLLRKYGYQPQQASTRPEEPQSIDNGLTFDQMVAQEEAKKRGEEMRRQQLLMGPKPITFDGQYDIETKYSSDDDTGFGFKIVIASDMKLPK
jgi:hypothetical protein